MKLTEENYVGIAEQAIKELCSEKDQKGRLGWTGNNIQDQKSACHDIRYL